MILKEDVIPGYVNKPLYILAPAIAIIAATIGFAVVPFGPAGLDAPTINGYPIEFQIAPDVDVGILYVFAIGSLAVYGVILAGWASNNKYSFLGGLRSSAQIISYEIPLGMSVLGMVLLARSLDLNDDHRLAGPDDFGFIPPGASSSSRSASCSSSSAPSPRRTACRSTCPSPSRSWSAASTPSTRR